MEILYEDDDIIVVNKESGLPVQAGTASRKDLISILKNHLCEEKGQTAPGTEEPYLGIVHRLDQPVEGLVVFAKTPQAASELSRQVQAKTKWEWNGMMAASTGCSPCPPGDSRALLSLTATPCL